MSSAYEGGRVELRFLSFTPFERKRSRSTRGGDELTMSYGDKSNEELLMLHGFAVPGNPNDKVMVALPLPPSSSWDEVTMARVELLKRLNCGLQHFLPSIPEVKDGNPGSDFKDNGQGLSVEIPLDLLTALEILCLKPEELEARLMEDPPEKSPGVDEVASILKGIEKIPREEAKVRLGLRMGALATLVKMLEFRVQELEGEQGTGTLEKDRRLIRRAVRAKRDVGGDVEVGEREEGGPAVSGSRAACIVYRYEQKRITRAYLVAARIKLQEVLASLNSIS